MQFFLTYQLFPLSFFSQIGCIPTNEGVNKILQTKTSVIDVHFRLSRIDFFFLH